MPMVSDWCQCIMKKYFIGCQWILKSLFVGICVCCTANGFYITFHWHSSVYFHDVTWQIAVQPPLKPLCGGGLWPRVCEGGGRGSV